MFVIEGNKEERTRLVNELTDLFGTSVVALDKPEIPFNWRQIIETCIASRPELIQIVNGSWIGQTSDDLWAEIEFGLPMQFMGQGIILNRVKKEVPYVERFPHWRVISTHGFTKADYAALANTLVTDYLNDASWDLRHDRLAVECKPPAIVGNPKSPVLFVAPATRKTGEFQAPFIYKSGLELLSRIGDDVTKVAMVAQDSVNPAYLKHFRLAFAFGAKASTWARYYARITEVVSLPAVHNVSDEEVEFIIKSIQSIKEIQ
jgi:hypothetical protein